MEIAPVILAGYFGYGNAGDEMILSLVRARLEPVLFLSGPRPAGSGAVPRFHFPSVWRALGRSRALVFAGGELFQTRTSVRSLFYYAALPWLARLRGRPTAVLGVALDPALGKWGRRVVSLSLRQAKSLWVRDETSRTYLAELGLSAQRMPDIVWAWPRPEVEKSKGLRRILWVLRFPKSGPSGEFSLGGRPWPREWEHDVLALDPTEDAEGIGRFRQSAPFFSGQKHWSDPNDLLRVFGRYDLIVTMRYHGLVCAALAGRAALAIPGHGKVRTLAEELGVPCADPWSGPVDWPAVLNRAFARGPADVGQRPHDARHALETLLQ